jgi:hypothetical protein
MSVPSVLAQSEAPTTTTTTPAAAQESDAGADDDAKEADEAGDDNTAEIIAAFVFGLLVIVAFLAYLYLVQDRFFDSAERAWKRLGVVPRAESVVVLTARSLYQQVDGGSTLTISGPAIIVVGDKGAATYSIPADDNNAAEWSVDPTVVASVDPSKGDSVKVTARTAGVFALNVQRGDGKGSISVTAVDLSGGASLPFVGAGYGTVLIALALLTVAAVLGMEGVLSGEALATLFGALAGYIFLKGADAAAANGSEKSKPETS